MSFKRVGDKPEEAKGHLDHARIFGQQTFGTEVAPELNFAEVTTLLNLCEKVPVLPDSNRTDPHAFTWYDKDCEVAESQTLSDGTVKLTIYSGPSRRNQAFIGEIVKKLIK